MVNGARVVACNYASSLARTGHIELKLYIVIKMFLFKPFRATICKPFDMVATIVRAFVFKCSILAQSVRATTCILVEVEELKILFAHVFMRVCVVLPHICVLFVFVTPIH